MIMRLLLQDCLYGLEVVNFIKYKGHFEDLANVMPDVYIKTT